MPKVIADVRPPTFRFVRSLVIVSRRTEWIRVGEEAAKLREIQKLQGQGSSIPAASLATVVWMIPRGVRWLGRKSVQHWLDRATGVVLVGFGVGLTTEAH